jgi:hypothetical protein
MADRNLAFGDYYWTYRAAAGWHRDNIIGMPNVYNQFSSIDFEFFIWSRLDSGSMADDGWNIRGAARE